MTRSAGQMRRWEDEREVLVENCEFLLGVGTGATEVVTRLGKDRRALVRQLERAGRNDLARKIDLVDMPAERVRGRR